VLTERQMRLKLGGATVAVVGCGGLGSNVASMLVRAGIGKLVLIDFDRVEAVNLDRQFFFADQVGQVKVEALAENLRRIREDVEFVLSAECVTADNLVWLVTGADVIAEAVDDARTKAMIANICMRDLPDVPLVTVSGLAGAGSVNAIVTERLAEKLYVVGDLESDVTAGLPLVSSRVMAAAAAQAHMVLRLLLGYTEP
jgi:sulfur carrier protein ThiS adenylyltransferase